MKRYINFDIDLGGGGGQIPQGCQSYALGYRSCAVGYGYCSHRNKNRYGLYGSYNNQGQDGQQCYVGQGLYDYWTGNTQSHSEGEYPHIAFNDADLDVYIKHVYRQELEINGLTGIGTNIFGLTPTVDRDDLEICIEVVNKFSNMGTNFEKRLQDALKRKKEIDERKAELLAKLKVKKEIAKSNFEQKVEKLRNTARTSGFEDFIQELQDERFEGFNPTQYLEQIKKDNVVPPKPKVPEKTDDDRVRYYIDVKLYGYGWYQSEGKEVDGLRYFDFSFSPSIDEDSSELDIFVELKGKVLETEEKSANETVRQVQDDYEIPNGIGNFLGKFTKKKTFVKKIRVTYDEILKKSKELYG